MNAKILYLLLVPGTLLLSNQVNLKDLNKMIDLDKKKIIIVDKKDLPMYLSNPEVKSKNIMNTNNDNAVVKKETVLKINSYNDYVANVDSLDKKIINMPLLDLLLSAKYLFENNKPKEMYAILQPFLLEQGKDYKVIDYDFFKEGIENMNLETAKELIKVIKGLDNE